MNWEKTGALIRRLRIGKGMTQRELACCMNLSDKTISKWELGHGSPDVSVLKQLSILLDVQVESLLTGECNRNERDGNNMKRIQFMVCPVCGSIFTATGEGEVTCCGRRLSPLEAVVAQEGHCAEISPVETEYLLSFDHPMEKAHYLAFVAVVTYDRVLLIKLYPEQSPQLRIPQLRKAQLFTFCSEHGLVRQLLP